jgi:hypothetical protein
MALVFTKADRLPGERADAEKLAADRFGMTRHALESHCPHNAILAVSCLQAGESGKVVIAPTNLDTPVNWLATILQAQDAARIEWLFGNREPPISFLQLCVGVFARRYPDAAETADFRSRLRQARLRRIRRRVLTFAATAAAMVFSLWSYDAYGYSQAVRFEAEHADAPAAAVQRWHSFQSWHPTRHFTRVSKTEAEEVRLRELERDARRVRFEVQLTDLRRRAADADADATALWEEFQLFRAEFPDVDVTSDLSELRTVVQSRNSREQSRRAQRAFDDLLTAEGKSYDLAALIEQADRFLGTYSETPHSSEVRSRRDGYLARLDERVIEVARAYSAKNPFNFQTRHEHYQRYLDKYPAGIYASEAQAAIRAIQGDWDKHDFRAVRDHFLAKPGEIPELVNRCRTYLAVHPQGRFTSSAVELLRWSERITAPGEYRVTLCDGQFEKKIARFFSRGPDLSVEIEVAGVKHGPSSFYKNRYEPEWNYEYPRRIRWKLGDPVTVRVIDNDWRKRTVVEISSADSDPLAIRMLTGELWSGNNRVTFDSDFRMPTLPVIE